MTAFLVLTFLYNSTLYSAAGEQRQAHFRSISPAHPQSTAVPQTGLGILMGGSAGAPGPVPAAPPLLAPHPTPAPPPPPANPYAHLTPEQQTRIQEDLADRERQASALAAAGMVADSVNLTRPAVIGQVLQAPPPLVGIAPPAAAPAAGNASGNGEVQMEGINWNNMLDLGPSVDDMDMDFAAMFDPEQEQAFMTTAPAAAKPEPAAPAPTPPSQGVMTEEYGTPNPLNPTAV